MEKDLSLRSWKHSQSCLRWADHHWFLSASPWRYRSADVRAVAVIAGLTALKTFYLQALVQPTLHRKALQTLDRDGWDIRMLSALDAFPLTCSNCVAECFRDLWNTLFEKPVAVLLDSEILLEHCCFPVWAPLLKPGFLPIKKDKTAKFRKALTRYAKAHRCNTKECKMLRIICLLGKWESHQWFSKLDSRFSSWLLFWGGFKIPFIRKWFLIISNRNKTAFIPLHFRQMKHFRCCSLSPAQGQE